MNSYEATLKNWIDNFVKENNMTYVNEMLQIVKGNKYKAPCDNFLPAKDLKIGDYTLCLVSRLSANYDTWLNNTSLNHGWTFVPGKVVKILQNGKRVIKLHERIKNEYSQVLGQERYRASVGGVGYNCDHIVKYLKKRMSEEGE